MLKPAVYSAVDQLFLAKICSQLGVNLQHTNTDEWFSELHA